MTAPLIGEQVTSGRFKAVAHEHYARWRVHTPVVRARINRHEVWLVSRYDDVSMLLRSAAFSKVRPGGEYVPAFLKSLTRNMLAVDGADHARLKRAVQDAFTPRRIDGLETWATRLADELTAGLPNHGTQDLVPMFAMPFPVTVIAELLGVPAADRTRFARWSRALVGNDGSLPGLLRALPGMIQFVRYLRRHSAHRRARPSDDLAGALAAMEIAGQLDGDEVVAMLALLLTAGHETTTNIIANGLATLLSAPDALAALRQGRADPRLAVEELLRFCGPVETSTPRFAKEPITIAGEVVPCGAEVLGVITSANRDAAKFALPDQLDLNRDPNRHLSFGEGAHYCAGAALARMETRVALMALILRWPTLNLAVGCPTTWRSGPILRGLTALKVDC